MKLGFIGTGLMGHHMARNLLKGDHELTVYDIRKEATDEAVSLGATWADSSAAVARASEVVFTCLPMPQDVLDVATGEDGILSGAAPGTAYFDMSTTDPDTIRAIAEAAGPKDVHVLDAPISGGTTGAEAGTLCIMVGGDQATYDRCKPVLDLMGDKAMYCGALGSGAVCKIVNNLIGMSVSVLLSEAFTLGTKAGVDPMTLYEVIRKSSGNTQTMQTFPQELFVGNFEPGFMLDLGSKDLGLATQLARSLRVPMNMGNLAHQRYIEAQNAGLGRQSIFAVTKIQEELAGVEVRTTR